MRIFVQGRHDTFVVKVKVKVLVKVMIERKIFRSFPICLKKRGLPFKKSSLTSFDLKDYSQGHHRIAREK